MPLLQVDRIETGLAALMMRFMVSGVTCLQRSSLARQPPSNNVP